MLLLDALRYRLALRKAGLGDSEALKPPAPLQLMHGGQGAGLLHPDFLHRRPGPDGTNTARVGPTWPNLLDHTLGHALVGGRAHAAATLSVRLWRPALAAEHDARRLFDAQVVITGISTHTHTKPLDAFMGMLALVLIFFFWRS
jgi:hypothetical protein